MSHSPTHPEPSTGLHKDWRLWVAVILMLVAIMTYVLTLDDSIVPQVTPAAATPAPQP